MSSADDLLTLRQKISLVSWILPAAILQPPQHSPPDKLNEPLCSTGRYSGKSPTNPPRRCSPQSSYILRSCMFLFPGVLHVAFQDKLQPTDQDNQWVQIQQSSGLSRLACDKKKGRTDVLLVCLSLACDGGTGPRVVQQRNISCNMQAAAARGASHKDDHSLRAVSINCKKT